jgi:hypothetical protein
MTLLHGEARSERRLTYATASHLFMKLAFAAPASTGIARPCRSGGRFLSAMRCQMSSMMGDSAE